MKVFQNNFSALKERSKEGAKSRMFKFEQFVLLVITLVMIGALSLLSPYFLTFQNMMNIILQVSMTGIVAVGMTFVILTSGIDLSVGSILAMSTGLAGTLLWEDHGTLIALAAVLGVSALLGFINGLNITILRLPPLVATLGMMSAARGGQLIITQARTTYDFPESILFFGQAKFFQIPFPAIFTIIMFIIGGIILVKTSFGRQVYALGDNEAAARMSGISTNRIKLMVYTISGFLSGFAGLILMARMNSTQPTMGQGLELDVIGAVVIGGASLMGGRGSMLGTFFGVIIVGLIFNGLNLLNIDPYWQMVCKGLIIIGAVAVDVARKVE